MSLIHMVPRQTAKTQMCVFLGHAHYGDSAAGGYFNLLVDHCVHEAEQHTAFRCDSFSA